MTNGQYIFTHKKGWIKVKVNLKSNIQILQIVRFMDRDLTAEITLDAGRGEQFKSQRMRLIDLTSFKMEIASLESVHEITVETRKERL